MSGPDRLPSDTQLNTSVASTPQSGAQIDPSDTKWAEIKNFINFKSGRFDDATKEQYARHFDDYQEKADCRRCEKNRDFFLQYSETKDWAEVPI